MAEEERPISIVLETTEGTSVTVNLSCNEAYTLGVNLIGQSGVPGRDEKTDVLDQLPMMAIDEPQMAFAASHSDALLIVIKPANLRPIHVTVSRDTAEQIHEALGKALDDAQGRPTIRTQ